jgi:hypothetical protein
MSITSKRILPVGELLALPLHIPDYQRPYRWQAFHVNQLLDDLLFHRGRQRYRLGTVVLHAVGHDANTHRHDIVDGQQRLLTLVLLCHQLDFDAAQAYPLLKTRFASSVSIAGLRHNADVLRQRLVALSDGDRSELRVFILERCELICVTLNSLNEAFQFFDAQNARGVPLRPHDLLKAYHLREMDQDSEKERSACVGTWEDSVSPKDGSPSLEFIMGSVLFRLRRWSTGRSAQKFTRKDVGIFKGISLRTHNYPYVTPMRDLDSMCRAIQAQDKAGGEFGYSYLVDQVMLNGRHFFHYVRHYILAYATLFDAAKPQLATVLATLRTYNGRGRTGDRYVWELFTCAVLYYYDKFGDDGLERAVQLCFVWAYRLRLTQSRVELATIDNAASHPDGVIGAIRHAIHPQDVTSLSIAPVERTSIKATKVDGVLVLFTELGYVK